MGKVSLRLWFQEGADRVKQGLGNESSEDREALNGKDLGLG